MASDVARNCPTCKQPLKPAAAQRRTVTKAKESSFTPGHCHACGVPTLTGWTEALLCVLDARPLNEIGELAAVHNGMVTFARKGDRFVNRSASARRTFPDRPITIHVEHHCNQEWPEALRLPLNGRTSLSHKLNTSTSEFPTEPNF